MEEKSKNNKKNTNPKDENSNANQTNLWNEILREALAKKDLDQSHLFVFGDKNSGKKTIIKNINKDLLNRTELDGKNLIKLDTYKRGLNNEEKVSKYALIDYTYLNIKKLNDVDSDVIGNINVWVLNEFLEKYRNCIIKGIFLKQFLNRNTY